MTTDADLPALPDDLLEQQALGRPLDAQFVIVMMRAYARAAIAADRERAVRTALAELERVAIGAVYHVGAANYAEREREALQWVRKAADAARAALAEQPASAPEGWRRALHAAAAAIYFADSSDYKAALWSVVSELHPATAELLKRDEHAAFESTQAMLAASPQPPTQQEES